MTMDFKRQEIEATIENLQLDQKASSLLRRLDPTEAVVLLQSMESDVRNPSAFITKAANDRLNGKVDIEGHRWKQVSALAEELGLDERAQNVVMELPSMEALRVLTNCKEKIDSVNNPSAFVLKGVAAVQKEMGIFRGPPTRLPDISALAEELGLDERAQKVVMELPQAEALRVLSNCKDKIDTVNNPSAFVLKGVAAVQKEMGVFRNPFTHSAKVRSPMDEVAALTYQLGLDERAQNVVMELPPEEAYKVLANCKEKLGSVNNPSAFVLKGVAAVQREMGISRNPPTQSAKVRGYQMAPRNSLDEVAALAQELGLDERAQNVVMELPPADACAVLVNCRDKLDTVKNPSAFVLKGVAAVQKEMGIFRNPSTHATKASDQWAEASALAEELGLDERAKNVVMELPAAEACRVLSNCRDKLDSVKNPSAFVLKGVAAVQKEMRVPQGGYAMRAATTPSFDHRWNQVSALAIELGLDERARAVVSELSTEEAYRVLVNCKEKAGSINNPSAYVLKGVAAVQREMMDQSSKRRRLA